MQIVEEISNVLIWLIRAGAGFRIVYCLFRMVSSEDEHAMFKKRAKHTLVFYVIAESAFVIKALALSYFG